MSFVIVEAVPSSAVANGGTITFAYPGVTSAGDFAGYGHKSMIQGLQNAFSQDAGDFDVAFGASNMTYTHRRSTSIPANTKVRLQLEIRGAGQDKAPSLVRTKRIAYDPLIRIDLGAPDAAAANSILTSQNLTSAGVFSVAAFNGTYGVANSYAQLDVPRNVVAAWTTNAVLTITGQDEYGNTVVEKSAGGSASFTGKKAFSKITSIATDTNITALTVGTGDVLGLPIFVEKPGQILTELEDSVAIGGLASKVRINWFAEQVSLLAGTTASIELVAPCAGTITKLVVVTRAAVTTGGNVTVNVGAGAGTAVVGLTVAVANASAKGTTTSDTPTGDATAVVAKNDRIQIVLDDAFATAGAIDGYLEIQPSGTESGTLVAGVQTKPTATTGDVRGTYDPESACDGTKSFSLIAAVSDPTYLGVNQFAG